MLMSLRFSCYSLKDREQIVDINNKVFLFS